MDKETQEARTQVLTFIVAMIGLTIGLTVAAYYEKQLEKEGGEKHD